VLQLVSTWKDPFNFKTNTGRSNQLSNGPENIALSCMSEQCVPLGQGMINVQFPARTNKNPGGAPMLEPLHTKPGTH
jgi:hypothetical protein